MPLASAGEAVCAASDLAFGYGSGFALLPGPGGFGRGLRAMELDILGGRCARGEVSVRGVRMRELGGGAGDSEIVGASGVGLGEGVGRHLYSAGWICMGELNELVDVIVEAVVQVVGQRGARRPGCRE